MSDESAFGGMSDIGSEVRGERPGGGGCLVVGVPTGGQGRTALPGLSKNDLFCHLSFVICYFIRA